MAQRPITKALIVLCQNGLPNFKTVQFRNQNSNWTRVSSTGLLEQLIKELFYKFGSLPVGGSADTGVTLQNQMANTGFGLQNGLI